MIASDSKESMLYKQEYTISCFCPLPHPTLLSMGAHFKRIWQQIFIYHQLAFSIILVLVYRYIYIYICFLYEIPSKSLAHCI